MHKPFDQFGKTVVATFLELCARVELECAVHHPAQAVDIAFEPDEQGSDALDAGWLARIAATGPAWAGRSACIW